MSKAPVVQKRAMFKVSDGVKPEAKRMNAVMPGAPAAPEEKCFPGVSLDTVQEEPYQGASEAPAPKVKPKWPSRLKAISVSVAEFGRLTGTPLRTIKGWATGENETHGWVEPMISLMERDPANILALKTAMKEKNEQS